MNTCRLCLNSVNTEAYNLPLFENNNFSVLPSMGALVEGWLLLLPKKHFICVGALPESLALEFQQLKDVAAAFIQDVYGGVSVFEHGPHRHNRKVGCGVDHAHLHILPSRFDLLSAVSPFVPESTRWLVGGLPECRAAYSESKDYLYLEQQIGNGSIAVHDSFGSQLFRRGIAHELGVPNEYNWREFPNLKNVERTIRRAQQWSSHNSIATAELEAAA
jgi:ATP adenylyltransferase